MKSFKQFMQEENIIGTAVNQAMNPIRRAVGAKTVELPPGKKEVDYSKFIQGYDKAMSGFGGADPAKTGIGKPAKPTKIQDRVPEQPERDKPPAPQDSTDLEKQKVMMDKLKAMKQKLNLPE